MKECCKTNNNQPVKKNYLQKLQDKWKLNSLFQVIIVLIIFALGGSTCAFLGRQIMPAFGFESKNFGYWVVYILLVTLLWPMCVLAYSIILGQYPFFKKYLGQMGRRMIGKK